MSTYEQGHQLSSRPTLPAPPPQARTIEEIHRLAVEVGNECANTKARLENLAGRLGYHEPKANSGGSAAKPVPNGCLQELMDTLRATQNTNSETLNYLTEIERHI